MAPPVKHSRMDAINIIQGLNQVYAPDAATDDPSKVITVDIVAVGGLAAVPGTTWTSKQNGVRVNWLQDKDNMLPKAFPTARIMEFQYPSKYIGEGAVSQSLRKVAEALLDALVLERKGCSTRPIIFVGHCLGGLVVENAICIANARMNDFKAVYNAIAGVVFLATPFLGTKKQLIGAFFREVYDTFGKASETELLSLLEYKNKLLQELLDSFGVILNETSLPTYCFYETLKADLSHTGLGKWWRNVPIKGKIIEDESAIIPGRKEKSTYLHRDHFDINKFTGAQDDAYNLVREQLRVMIHGANVFVKGRLQYAQRALVQDDKYEEIKKQLRGFDEDAVLSQVKKSRPDMFQPGAKAPCSFILETPEWKRWLQPPKDGPEALWIRGKKGQGKTLFAVDVIEKYKKECSKNSLDGQNFFVYGLCDGSKPDTSSAVNLLKVILRQLVSQARDLARHFLKTSKSTYTVPSLVQQLRKVSNDPIVGTIYIVVDGIDSLTHDGSRNDLLHEISQLLRPKSDAPGDVNSDEYDNRSETADQSNLRIKLLVLSNNLDDDIAESLKNQAFIDLTDEKYKSKVDQGLNEDFSQRIVEFSRRRKYGPPSEYILKSYIKSKAQSDSTWVTLACGEIEALEVPKSEIRGYLDGLPVGTGALFKRIMDRILDKSGDQIEVTRELFRCLLLTKWDPNIDELAVMAGFSDDERADRSLLYEYVNQCAPFVILDSDSNTVEFATPEVQDLFKNYAGEMMFPSDGSKKLQHGLIALRCFDYILNNTNSTELISSIDKNTYEDNNEDEIEDSTDYVNEGTEQTTSDDTKYYPGLIDVSYAQEYWLEHAKDADTDMLDSLDLQSSFWELGSIVRENWWTAYTEVYVKFKGLSGMSALHIAAFFGFEALLDRLLNNRRKELEMEDSWGNQPLYWAARIGHENTVKILLKEGVAVDGHGKGDTKGLTALHGAATYGHDRIVDDLLKHKANVNFYHDEEGSALFQACASGRTDIVRTLLKAGANANLGANAHTTPLQGAIWSSQVELVRTILDRGVDAEYGSDKTFDFTPLWSASDLGYTDIVDLLLERGANINWSSEECGNSLSAACQRSSIETVQSLLRARPNVACQQEALKQAVWGGSVAVVALLLEHNPRLRREEAFVRASSNGDIDMLKKLADGRAPISQEALDKSLYLASDNEFQDVVNFLLSLRANPSARGNTYGSALGAACYDGTFDIAKALVDKDANVNQVGGNYGTPLQAASFRGSLEIVQLLLSKGARPDDQICGQYATPLQAAAVAGSEEIVKLLLDRGANIDAVGGEQGTALLAAANGRHPEILKLLVERGADVNIVSKEVNEGEPALQVAAWLLAADVVQLLLDHGAEVDQVDNVGYTPLMAAAAVADLDAVKMLLGHGANVHQMDKDGVTPIISAVQGGNLEICKLFIEMEVDLNCENHEGSTPLMEAVQLESLELCQLLVEHGAEIEKKTNHQRGTALHQACFIGNSSLLQFFLDKNADINAKAGKWETCLQASVLRANNEFITKVLDAGADINATGGKYHTALAAAAYALSADAASLLLERGADPNITGGYYGSALASAAAKGWTNMIDMLLPRTSQAVINDALSQAILYRRASTVDKLLENGAKVNVASGRFAIAAKALDEKFQPHSNDDDDIVFEGYNIQTDDATDFAQTQDKADDDELELSKEDYFKYYCSNEFVAPTQTKAPLNPPKTVENIKLKARETAIKTSLRSALQNSRNLDALVAPSSAGAGGFGRNLPFRSQRSNGTDGSATVSGLPMSLFGNKSNRDSNSTNRHYGDYDTDQVSSNKEAAAYGAAGTVVGAAVGASRHGFGDDEADQSYPEHDIDDDYNQEHYGHADPEEETAHEGGDDEDQETRDPEDEDEEGDGGDDGDEGDDANNGNDGGDGENFEGGEDGEDVDDDEDADDGGYDEE